MKKGNFLMKVFDDFLLEGDISSEACHSLGSPSRMHEHIRYAERCHCIKHIRVHFAARDIVHHCSASIDSLPSDSRSKCIDTQMGRGKMFCYGRRCGQHALELFL